MTREVVMSAILREYSAGFFMDNEGGWVRTESSTGGWINGSSDRAVIDYRITEPGNVQIRWGRWGSWVTDSSGTQKPPAVERQVTYRMRYAVAEMHRKVADGACQHIFEGSGDVLAASELPIKVRSGNGSAPVNDKFLAALLYADGSGPRDGVSAIVRAIMAAWGAQLAEAAAEDGSIPPLGHAPRDSQPFGKEEAGTYYEGMGLSRVEYPFFYGDRAGRRTGSYYAAARAFMALGILAIVIAVLRVVIGPPVLTSWMGQHVSLALLSGTAYEGLDGLEGMASGYQVAARNLGRWRVVSARGRTRFQLHETRFDVRE